MIRSFVIAAIAAALCGSAHAQQGNPGQHFLEQWDADANGNVTPTEVATKRSEVFAMFDQDSDKTLSEAEWALVAEHMALELGQGGAGHGMNMAAPGKAVHVAMSPAFNDTDLDGNVTQEEFESASAKLFGLMDGDGDGAVTVADFAR